MIDIDAYYNIHSQRWQLLINIDQDKLDLFMESDKEVYEEVKDLIEDALMKALGY